jgi:hypothetical protein
MSHDQTWVSADSVLSVRPSDVSTLTVTAEGGDTARTLEDWVSDRINAKGYAQTYAGMVSSIAAAAGKTLYCPASTYALAFTTSTAFTPEAHRQHYPVVHAEQ